MMLTGVVSAIRIDGPPFLTSWAPPNNVHVNSFFYVHLLVLSREYGNIIPI